MQENTDEAVDQFHVRLLQNARYCEFANVDMEIKAQIELGTNSKQLRRYAFRHPKITLCELLDYGRILETDEKDAHVIEKQVIPEKLHEMNALKQYTTRKMPGNKTCFQCGYACPHVNGCSAKGTTCNKCKKPNHLAQCCNMKSPQPRKESQEQRSTSFRSQFPKHQERIKQVGE